MNIHIIHIPFGTLLTATSASPHLPKAQYKRSWIALSISRGCSVDHHDFILAASFLVGYERL